MGAVWEFFRRCAALAGVVRRSGAGDAKISVRESPAWPNVQTVTLEVPDHSAAHEVIVLAALACGGQGQIRRSGPEVAEVETKTEPPETMLEGIHIQSKPGLNYARGRRAAGVLAEKQEILIFAEVAETAAETHPGRNRGCGKQVHAGGGRNEDLFVVLGNDVARVEVLIKVEHHGHFS